MLIYNFKKEFVGIDEKDLKTLGFSNLQGLRTEVHDFADLFVKTPGYVHNFKHVHWIDFISCAESNEESKVIINVNNKNYTATIHIATTYLVDNPSAKGFLVSLTNLRELSSAESQRISGDITQREAPLTPSQPQEIFNNPTQVQDEYDTPEVSAPALTPDPYESPLDISMEDETPFTQTIQEVAPEIKPATQVQSLDVTFDEPEDALDVPLDIPLDIDIDDDFEDVLAQETSIEEDRSTHIEKVKESFDNGYTYDPQVASEELGLPIDLIEEFIQDFIEQAKEFKDDLYKHVQENDLDNLKILSHKLKGVAANLRIEDALETITVVNTESNINIISQNLDTFYKIIAKLSGEKILVEKEIPNEVTNNKVAVEEDKNLEIEEDLYSDPLAIDDSDVPQKIEIPELADDDFLDVDLEIEKKEIEEDSLPIDEPTEINYSKEDVNLEIEEDIKIDIEPKIDLADDFKIELNEEDSLPIDEPTEINYSKEIVANEIGLDIESFNELFEDYIMEVNDVNTSIKKALEDQDFDTLHQEALKLKGMSENMRVTSFSSDLDTLLNSKEVSLLENAFQTIEKTIEQLSNKEG